MKSSRQWVMTAISILAALLAVVFASRWMSEQARMKTNQVVVAATDIDLGTRLTPNMVRLVEWPAGSMPKGGIVDLAALDTRVTRVSLQRGEPLMETKLAPRGATGGLSAVVAEGKRAMTVRVNDVIGVAGFALPGNYVDILVSTEDESRRSAVGAGNISKLVLERILVLAVAQEASANDTKPKVVNAVTLEVTPKEAEKLDLARSVGQLSLVLRNQVDTTPARTDGATKRTLLHLPSVAPPSPPAEAPKKVVARAPVRAPVKEQCQQVLTGNGRISQCFQ